MGIREFIEEVTVELCKRCPVGPVIYGIPYSHITPDISYTTGCAYVPKYSPEGTRCALSATEIIILRGEETGKPFKEEALFCTRGAMATRPQGALVLNS